MFVKLELSILETNLQRLSGADFRALIAMSKYVDNTGRCFPSVPRIADDIGVKRRMVQRSMRRLEEVGLIKTEMVGGGRYRPNKYRLLHFTFGKNENSDKSDAVMGEKGDSPDAVTEKRNSDKTNGKEITQPAGNVSGQRQNECPEDRDKDDSEYQIRVTHKTTLSKKKPTWPVNRWVTLP